MTVSVECYSKQYQENGVELSRRLSGTVSGPSLLNDEQGPIYNNGVVTASHVGFQSSQWDERYIYAMDGNTGTKYSVMDDDVASGATDVWVQWTGLDNRRVIYNRLRFFSGSEGNRLPSNLYVRASNDGNDWVTLWSSSVNLNTNTDYYYTFDNCVAYNMYRIYMGQPDYQGLEVMEMQLSWTYIGGWSLVTGTLSASHEGYNLDYDERYMHAFDGNTNNKFTAMDEDAVAGNADVWIQITSITTNALLTIISLSMLAMWLRVVLIRSLFWLVTMEMTG